MDGTPEIQRESRDLLEEVAVEYLRGDGAEVEIPSGETILRRGDSVGDFWVILEGEVEVRRRSKHDGHLTLARRGPGGTFGEVANLRSAPVSADVIAVTPVRALRCPATLLPTALTECESLRRTLLTRLADGLRRTADDAWGLYRRTRALAGLLSGGVSPDAMVAVSARMRAAKAKLLQVAPERALVSRTFRNRNVDELRSVVELAVRVADGHEIRAEHVFSGFAELKPIGLDVSEFWLVRWLVAGRGLRHARLAVAAFSGNVRCGAVICVRWDAWVWRWHRWLH